MRVSIKLPNRTIAVSGLVLGAAVALSSLAVVRAERVQPDKSKTFSCSSGFACLTAKSNGTPFGVYGTSASAAVVGVSTYNEGVAGSNTSSSALYPGVGGASNGTAGVIGQSSASTVAEYNAGVWGYNTGGSPGVYAESVGGVGLYAQGGNGNGANGIDAIGQGGDSSFASYAYSPGYGTYAEGGGLTVVSEIQGDYTYTDLLYAYNAASGGFCVIDYGGDLQCSGSIIGALRPRHRTMAGQRVLAYASESASATIEDAGEAKLYDGVANVMIPSDFASVIDRHSNYYVFLTPLGDTRGLYVSMKTPTGFQVRETEHGRTSLAFDYRILARPADANDDRLPLAPRVRRFHSVPPPHLTKPRPHLLTP